jgi:hypothetical protein
MKSDRIKKEVSEKDIIKIKTFNHLAKRRVNETIAICAHIASFGNRLEGVLNHR